MINKTNNLRTSAFITKYCSINKALRS